MAPSADLIEQPALRDAKRNALQKISREEGALENKSPPPPLLRG